MTEKNALKKQFLSLGRVLLAASLCAGLMLTGCGSSQTEVSGNSSNSSDSTGMNVPAASSDAATSEAASDSAAENSTAGQSAVSGTASTGVEYSDPDWAADEQETVFSARDKGLLIVIDPGHSSQVPGTMEPVGPDSTEMKEADTVGTFGPSSELHEYELTMKLSQKLRNELEARGYEVKLTHFDTLNPIGCIDRAAVANENHADAFIRIHANGSEDTDAAGAMTICITQDNPYHPELYSASYRLSEILLDTYCEQTGIAKEKVWETDTMTGNNWSEVPATLLELGYMTNPDEDLKMAQDSYQKRAVKAIADGLDRWFAEMPEEELSMHPSLAEALSENADTSSTGDTGSETAAESFEDGGTESDEQTTDDGTESGQQTTDDGTESGQQTTDDGAAAAVPAGTAAGTGTGVSADTGSTSE